MNTLIKIALACLAVAAIAGLSAYYYLFEAGDRLPLETMLPADTPVCAQAENVRKLALKASASRYGEVYRAFASAFAGAAGLAAQQLQETADRLALPAIEPELAFALVRPFHRQVVFAWLPPDKKPNPAYGARPGHVGNPVLLAHFQGEEAAFADALERLTDAVNAEVARLDPDREPLVWVEQIWRDVTIRTLPLGDLKGPYARKLQGDLAFEPSWALYKGRFVAAGSPEKLIAFLQSQPALEPAESLHAQPAYAKALADYPDARDLTIFLRFRQLMETMAEAADEALRSDPAAAALPIDARRSLEAVGFMEIEIAYLAGGLTPGSEVMHAEMRYDRPRGFLALYRPDLPPASFPPFAPEEKIYNIGGGSIDIGETVLVFKEIVLDAMPALRAFYPGQKDQLDALLGRDVEQFLDETFKPEMHLFNDIVFDPEAEEPEFATPLVIAVGLDEADALEELIGELTRQAKAAGNIASRSISGASYRYMELQNEELGDSSLAWAFVGDYLLFGMGGIELFETTLERAVAPGDDPAAPHPRAAALEGLEEGEHFYQITDIGLLIRRLSRLLESSLPEMEFANDQERRFVEAIRWDKLRNVELPLVSKTYFEEGRVYTKTIVAKE